MGSESNVEEEDVLQLTLFLHAPGPSLMCVLGLSLQEVTVKEHLGWWLTSPLPVEELFIISHSVSVRLFSNPRSSQYLWNKVPFFFWFRCQWASHMCSTLHTSSVFTWPSSSQSPIAYCHIALFCLSIMLLLCCSSSNTYLFFKIHIKSYHM